MRKNPQEVSRFFPREAYQLFSDDPLVIEGVAMGNYFMQIAHFNGHDKKISYNRNVNPSKKIEYRERSEVWKIAFEKVKKMTIEIEKDVINPPARFSRLGCDSILVSEGTHSCITWAKEKLKIASIELKKSSVEKLVTITTLYTKKDKVHLKSAPSLTAKEL